METVRRSNEAVLAIYASGSAVDEAKEREIFRIIDGVTDFDGIASEVTGRFCRDLTEAQCREFGQVFIELLRTSSVKKLGRYRADRFDYLGEQNEGGEAVVETVAHFDEEEVSLVYHLALSGGEWRIVNYVVDGVDTVRNYQKQFTRLFSKEDYVAVVQRLRDRIARYGEEDSP